MGSRRRAALDEALGASAVKLSPEDLKDIEDALPAAAVAGDRYPAAVLAHMDSER